MSPIKSFRRKFLSSINHVKLTLKAKMHGLIVVPENIIYNPCFPFDVVIDCGCSIGAELAIHMSRTYGSIVYCVDPTLKHSSSLSALVKRYQNMNYIQAAIAKDTGMLEFYEPVVNESGSIFSSHTNSQTQPGQNYQVQAYSLSSLLEAINTSAVDYIKLDLEGAEYDLLANTPPLVLSKFKQIFVEFHHHCIPEYSVFDTRQIVDRLSSNGFKCHTLDSHNYLFIRIDGL